MAVSAGAEFQITCCVRGYHVYRDMWDASLGETLECEGANE